MTGTMRRFGSHWVVMAGGIATACAVDDLVSAPPPPQVATRRDDLSDPGIEKLVPIRFVNLLQCAGCADAATLETLQKALHAANDTFKATGIQFAMRSVERYWLSTFVDLRQADPCGGPGEEFRDWGRPNAFGQSVKSQLTAVFPDTPANAWPDADQKPIRQWLTSVETLYGKAEEMVVWLSENTSCGGGYWSAFPWSGRNVVMNGPNLAGEPYKLAHELGHYFGLVHTYDHDTARDPETNNPHTKAERWDLMYKPGTSAQNPHVFFDNWSGANANEASLTRIEQRVIYPDAGPDGSSVTVNNCSQVGGTVTCTLGSEPPGPDGGISGYTETYATGATQLKGMAFTFASGRGSNVMSYLGPFDNNNPPSSLAFSDTQVGLVRRYLRWDVQLDASETNKIKPGATISGRRPQLGAWDIRSPDAKIDFDGDGRRDIGVWIPPANQYGFGRFIILLSSWGFSPFYPIDVQFGKLGDVPVPADYDGDGRTDVAVFQPGNGVSRNDPLDATGYWRWCPTAATPTSTTCGHDGASPSPIAWGYRDSVPQPGLDFDGVASTTDLVYYRPTNGEWGFYTLGVGYGFRQLGPAGSVPLPGLYDSDWKTDIATYTPSDATFRLLRSEQSWNTLINRPFDSKFIPQPTGTSIQRGMGLPMAGMFRPQWVCNPICTYTVPRRSFSIWFPPDGTWTTLWNPVSSSTPDPSCQWGWGLVDVPLPGVDRNGDGYTDLAVFRAPDYSANAGVFMKASTVGGCTGQQYPNIWYSSLKRPRTRSTVVADMTGDGLPELLFVQPDTMTVTWATSETTYNQLFAVQLGTQRAVFF